MLKYLRKVRMICLFIIILVIRGIYIKLGNLNKSFINFCIILFMRVLFVFVI